MVWEVYHTGEPSFESAHCRHQDECSLRRVIGGPFCIQVPIDEVQVELLAQAGNGFAVYTPVYNGHFVMDIDQGYPTTEKY